MSIRTPIKDALRASIADEDAALARRLPTRAVKRRASVKLSTKAVKRMSADLPARARPAKPIEVTLSLAEAEQLTALRDRLRAGGTTVGRRELLRVAVELLESVAPDVLRAQLKALPALSKRQGKLRG